MAYLSKLCGDFCLPNTLRKVSSGETNQYFISYTASIAPCDMQGGFSLKINFYNGMKKWSVRFSIAPMWFHFERNL